MRVSSLLQLFRRTPRYTSLLNGHRHQESEVQTNGNGVIHSSYHYSHGTRRRRWLVISAFVVVQFCAGIHSISKSIESDDTPKYLEIPSTPPPPLSHPFKTLAPIPGRLLIQECFKLLISVFLLLLFGRGHSGRCHHSTKRHTPSPPQFRFHSEHHDREWRRSRSPSRGVAARHNRASRSPSVANGSIMTRGSVGGSRTTLMWDADTEAGRLGDLEHKPEEYDRPLVMSELRPDGASREQDDNLEESGVWLEASGRRVPVRLVLGTAKSLAALAFLAVVMMGKSYVTLMTAKYTDAISLHLSSTLVPLFVAVFMSLLLAHNVSLLQWQAMWLQICGIFLAEVLRTTSSPDVTTLSMFAGLALFTGVALVILDFVFKAHESPSTPFRVNVVYSLLSLFASCDAIIIALIGGVTTEDIKSGLPRSHELWSVFLHASVDVVGVLVVFYYDAIVFGIASASTAALLLLYTHSHIHNLSNVELGGAMIAIVAFVTYVTDHHQPTEGHKSNRLRIGACAASLIAALVYILTTVTRSEIIPLPISPITASTPSIFSDFTFIPPPPMREPVCKRNELSSYSFYVGDRKYHKFDDVLLIVFFSHARYDVNLDYYKEVYSEFFPNMVFVGPGNREDLGFMHSYDVIVDSYQAEEDLSDPNNYKMAGRMAHHMLYTVLRDPKYSCYAGYLWAPFDTLLNVPRLQLFDQDRVWYHSPFAEFVPNPALNASLVLSSNRTDATIGGSVENEKGEVIAEQGKRPSSETAEEVAELMEGQVMNDTLREEWKLHAPPVILSPDPSVNWTKTYKGWWVDWWWGEPHVGLEVCMRAFRQTSRAQRIRLAAMTNGTRLLGGSADTLYIPRRLRAPFLETLGLFLETDCFLEISVPTAVHLVLEEGEKIQFVDHWWIFRPPFNVTFVRDKWKHGHEVDTFHTFHWGDKGEDGVWREIPKNIADVRQLLQDSAVRQGINLTTGENL